MLHHKFQETHAQLTELGANLLQYLIEFRQSRQGLDGTSLNSVQIDIQEALGALKENRYEVAVVAPMKAGKSTFLNSIIGADVLASESAACTICLTEIRHIQSGEVPSLREYWDNKQKGELLAEGDAHVIQQAFLRRTRELRINRENNPESPYPKRFELRYPIHAVQDVPALSGFTLIDTPGPNEWEAGTTLSREMVSLKQTTLAALRQCNVVIFVLNYRSVKDNASDELFKAITQNRQEFLRSDRARIYFILNQIDLRSEKDPTIEETLDTLRTELSKFGFWNPEIYPASAFQGLLSKLIQSGTATEGQVTDFRKFFSAKFAKTNEDGDLVIPAPHRIASAALEDSHIPEIQAKVFATVIQSAGWNLLEDVLKQFDKSAGAFQDTLNTEIAGWKQNIETLERRVKEYSRLAETARKKTEALKAKFSQQQELLIQGFEIAIDTFAKASKRQIQEEIDNVVEKRQTDFQRQKDAQASRQESHWIIEILNFAREISSTILTFLPVPQFVPRLIDAVGDVIVRGGRSLLEYLNDSMREADDFSEGGDPYRFKFSNLEQAERFHQQISDFCDPTLRDWWAGIEDRLVREGTQIREELTDMIRLDIQEISDELSIYLGEALEVEINSNPIQFPKFNFNGLDTQVAQLQERYSTVRNEKRKCFKVFEYEVPVKTDKTRNVYEINLRLVLRQIDHQIDATSITTKKTLKQVIKKQVQGDFQNAKKQLEDYINRFEQQLKCLLEERQCHVERTPEKIVALEQAQVNLKSLLNRLNQMKEALKSQ